LIIDGRRIIGSIKIKLAKVSNIAKLQLVHLTSTGANNMTLRNAILLYSISFCLIGCQEKAKTTQLVGQQASSSRAVATDSQGGNRHEFGEFSFVIPAGWGVVAPDRNKTKAMLLLDGTNWQNAKAMIKVDVGTPTVPTAQLSAEGFAKKVNGKVSADLLDFEGISAVSASSDSTSLETPRYMISIFRDDKVYLLMAGALKGVELTETISQIRKTWKWTK